MVVAGWQKERDDERFQEVLRNPTIVDREIEAALRGDRHVRADEEGEEARFEREGGGVVIAGR
jgi:hypothetical protein